MRKLIALFPLLVLFWMASAQAHGPVRQKIQETIEVNAPADKVWELVKDFCSIEKWHPKVAGCEAEGGNEKGGKRILKLEGGGEVVEELKKYNGDKMMYSYKIKKMSAAKKIVHAGQEIEVPVLPVANYSSIFQVKKSGDKAKVIWKGAFYRAYMNNNPPEEMNEDAAVKAVTEFYKSGLENLKKLAED